MNGINVEEVKLGQHQQPMFISILWSSVFQERVGHVVFVRSCDIDSGAAQDYGLFEEKKQCRRCGCFYMVSKVWGNINISYK